MQHWLSDLSPAHRDFSTFNESFVDILYFCRCWEVLPSFMLRNIIWKLMRFFAQRSNFILHLLETFSKLAQLCIKLISFLLLQHFVEPVRRQIQHFSLNIKISLIKRLIRLFSHLAFWALLIIVLFYTTVSVCTMLHAAIIRLWLNPFLTQRKCRCSKCWFWMTSSYFEER